MSNFFRSLFGAKKAAKVVQVAKSRMQTRRLELIGLEERITPATFANNSGLITIQLAAGESLTAISASAGIATTNTVITINTTSSGTNSLGTPNTGLSLVSQSQVTFTYVTANAVDFTGISILGSTGTETVAISGAVDLLNNNAATVSSFNVGSSVESLTVAGAVTAQGAVAGTSGVTLNATAVTIGAAGDIVTTAGNVSITGVISTAGNVNTTAGNILYTGATTLTGVTALASTGGTITLGTVTGAFGLTTTSTTGNVSVGAITGLGAVSISSTGTIGLTGAVSAVSVATPLAGAVTLGGSVTTTGATTFGGAVTGTSVNVIAGTTATFGSTVNSTGAISVVGAGVVTLTGAVGASLLNTGVTVTSTADNVVISSTVLSGSSVATGAVAISAATAGKTISLANAVTAGLNSNILLTGDVLSNAGTVVALNAGSVSGIGNGNITITGKVDAVTAGNHLTITAGTGIVTLTGNVGSSSTAFGTLTASGTGTFLASGTVNVQGVDLDNTNDFATSITFAKAVTATGALIVDGVVVSAGGAGTITFSDAITVSGTASSSAAFIAVSSTSGAIKIVGAVTGLDGVLVTSVSGAITMSGAVTTSGTNSITPNLGGDINIGTTGGSTGQGNVLLSGNISTTGTGNITLDNDGAGTLTINGNVSTAAVNQTFGPNGQIFIGADSSSSATGGTSVTINGTVTTTGTVAGDIFIGVNGGSVAVNKAVNAGTGADVIFITTVATDAITIASGATITAGDSVGDSGAGILNLGANITAGTASVIAVGIILDAASVNLTGAVSLKTLGTGADITVTTVNGAQNLTLQAIDQITLGDVGQATALSTITVANSAGVTVTGNFNGSVVLTDTTGAVQFNGANTTISNLTTALKGYSVAFGNSSADTTVLSGAPVFLNTGGVLFQGTTSLITGATITGNVTSTVTLADTIVSGGAFNIGAAGNTGVVSFANNTQLILNSTVASIIANPIAINGASAGTLGLLGIGTLTLSADSLTGTTGDSISVINGTLNVTGKIANATTATNGTITGAGGTIGALTVNTGTVAPGGTLNTDTVTLNAATNYKAAVLTTTTASNLKTAAAINLGSAVLSLSGVAAGLAVNNSFTIINNTALASVPIVGTFANQAEGSTISAKDTAGNTVAFTVSYKGGDGNDVTLKVTSITPSTPTPTAPAQPMVAGQPALNKFTAVGADAGGGPLVTITFQNGTYVSFFAYASTFTGGVRVALGDVNGDGSTDVITGAGPGGGPQVNVYNVNNATGAVSLQKSFFAFNAPSFSGGVYVAAGNTNGDAFADVIVGAGATGGSRVQVYAGSATGVVTSSTLNDFFAYSPAFTGGVVVAAGQRDAVAGDEIITAPASNGGYNIKSFNANGTGNSPTVVDNFFAFNNTTSVGGLSLAVGLLNSGSIADLIVGTTNGGYGVIVDSATAGIAGVPFAGFTGAIRAGVAEDANGQDFAVALAGPTGAPRISVFSVGATALTQTDSLFVMNTGFTGGLFGTPTLPATIVVA
jgi:hypothetical protein